MLIECDGSGRMVRYRVRIGRREFWLAEHALEGVPE